MDIFIFGIPQQTTKTNLADFLRPLMSLHGITKYDHLKTKNKGCAFLYVPNRAQGEAFLQAMSRQRVRYPGVNRKAVVFQKSNHQDGGSKIKIKQLEAQMEQLNIGNTLGIPQAMSTLQDKHELI